MDNNELKTLEEKTKIIVSTLESLEKETKEYQKKNVDIVAAITSLTNVSEQVATASKELSSSAALFSSSDFSKAMKEIDKRIDKINESEVVFTDQSKAINNIVENVLTEYKNLSSEIKALNNSLREFLEMQHTVNETKKLLEVIATKIDRIDRNTQKGFGKERG
jgi:DNA repair exonuclease SbcCD ATPase subunit